MVSMIDRYLLRYFLAVVDQGNFSRAAEACNVTQPTLSVGIAKLEAHLGKPLFNRTSRRVELTPAGVRLAMHARIIEIEFGEAEKAVADAPVRKLVRLGLLNSLAPNRILDMLARFGPEMAGQVELVEGRQRDMYEHLVVGRIDLALTIVRPEGDRFGGELLAEEGYSLALPAGHALAGRGVIHPEQLADQPMLVRRQCELLSETSHFFTRHGVRPFFAARTTGDDRALALVAAGLGITVMPEGHAAPGVARARLDHFDYRRKIGLLYADRFDPAESPLVAAIRASFA